MNDQQKQELLVITAILLSIPILAVLSGSIGLRLIGFAWGMTGWIMYLHSLNRKVIK